MNKVKPVVYQVYIPSFNDSNGDGIGDIKGVTNKIEYISSLDIDYIWISPIFKSPMFDNGYDVENFYKVNERYGDLKDLKELLKVFHDKGIKVVLDLVFNHTSHEHEWFKKAISGDLKYQNFYHFFDENSKYINKNLMCAFNQKAFTYVKSINKYYFNSFSKYQPDLNWENPLVRKELRKIVDFWDNFGFDGFRLDVFDMIGKDYNIMKGSKLIWDIAGNSQVKEWWQEVLGGLSNKYVVAECNVNAKMAKKYTIDSKINSVFTFDHLDERSWNHNGFSQKKWFEKIFTKLADVNNFGGDIAIALDNHDNPRVIDEFGGKWIDISKMLIAINIFNNSSSFIYQGNEFGMRNPKFKNLRELKDIDSQGTKDSKVLKTSRDNARTPIPWNKDEKYFGFSSHKPWLTEKYAQEFVGNDELIQLLNEIIKIRKNFKFWDRKLRFSVEDLAKVELSSKDNTINLYINMTNEQLDCDIKNEEIITFNGFNQNKMKGSGFVITLKKDK